jgi:hypothetical protein
MGCAESNERMKGECVTGVEGENGACDRQCDRTGEDDGDQSGGAGL